MNRISKTMLTIGTLSAIVTPVATVVACGTQADKESPEVKALKEEIGKQYIQLEQLIKTKTNDQPHYQELIDLRAKIAELTQKLKELGYEVQRSVISLESATADLTITDSNKAQQEINRIADIEARLLEAINDSSTAKEMKSYYPKYVRAHNELAKIKGLKDKIDNPPATANKATVYKVSDTAMSSFLDYFKPFFDGGAPITSYQDFLADPNNQIAKIGQVFGTTQGDEYTKGSLNGFKMEEGTDMHPGTPQSAPDLGLGMQQFNLAKGLVPHVDIKYDISKGTDDKSIGEFFSGKNVFDYPVSDLVAGFRGNGGAQTMNNENTYTHVKSLDPTLKLFPYAYTDEKNPGYIHFALFAYKNVIPPVTTPEGEIHRDTLRDYNDFISHYNNGYNNSFYGTFSKESIQRGIKMISDALGRDISKKENYYVTDDDFSKIMKGIYYAPQRDEMEYINTHISDKDRISLYWQTFKDANGNRGAFNTMASGRVFGIDPKDLYSGKDGAFESKLKITGTYTDDINGLRGTATPGYKTLNLKDVEQAALDYKNSEKFYRGNEYFYQRTPGRTMPTLAQSTLDLSTAMSYDLGGVVPFDKDSNGKITSFKAANFADNKQIQQQTDLWGALWIMSKQDMGWWTHYDLGINPQGKISERINPFLYGLKINYISVRNKDDQRDLDLVFKATRDGKALPTYKMTIPDGAMDWEQINEAVADAPVYSEPDNVNLSKEDFEFLMMRVMTKWMTSGDSVSRFILPSVSKLLTEGLKNALSIEEIDECYELLKNDSSVDLWRLKELITNGDLDFMDVFMSEGWDSTDRKTLYTRYGENLLNVIAKVSKHQILDNPSGVSQDVIDSLTNEFEGL